MRRAYEEAGWLAVRSPASSSPFDVLAIRGDEAGRAWAAGFFDGEGCTSVHRSSRHKYIYPRVSLSQKDRRALERFVEIVGEGNITGTLNARSGVYHWNVMGPGAGRVLALLWEFLGPVKREQAQRVYREVQVELPVPVEPSRQLIQCKVGGYMRPAERRELIELAEEFNAEPILASGSGPIKRVNINGGGELAPLQAAQDPGEGGSSDPPAQAG